MRKILLVLTAFVFAGCCSGTTGNLNVTNHSDKTVLVVKTGSWTGDKPYYHRLEAGQSKCIQLTNPIKREKDEWKIFDMLIKGESTGTKDSCCIYSEDTVLLRKWVNSYDYTSEEREFYRESDWRRYEQTDDISGCPFVIYEFFLTNMDFDSIHNQL